MDSVHQPGENLTESAINDNSGSHLIYEAASK